MSEDVTLKPCPFCGHPGFVTKTPANDYMADCRACDARVVYFGAPQEAITAWNTRAGEQSAYQRGKAEERTRIAAGLEALKLGIEPDNTSHENVWYGAIDEAIAIATQE